MYCLMEFKVSERERESFDLISLSVADNSTSRRDAVRIKTAEYLQYAEILQGKLMKKKQKLQVIN